MKKTVITVLLFSLLLLLCACSNGTQGNTDIPDSLKENIAVADYVLEGYLLHNSLKLSTSFNGDKNEYSAHLINTDKNFDDVIYKWESSPHFDNMYELCELVFDGTDVNIRVGVIDSKGKLIFEYDGKTVTDNR